MKYEKRPLDASLTYPMVMPDGYEVRQIVHLNRVIDHPRMEIGDFTYWHNFDDVADYAARLAPYLFDFSPDKLIIGKFCQIAHGVKIITASANHDMRGFTTYPFANFTLSDSVPMADVPGLLNVHSPKPDTHIGHDVWIGLNATIMSGVRIGNGAIIASESVVVKDVAPYSIIGGNPAREIRKRFDSHTIEALQKMAWWDWPADEIDKKWQALISADVSALSCFGAHADK